MDLGMRMPFCAGMGADRQFYSFDAQAGRAAVLLLNRTADASVTHRLADQLACLGPELASLEADLVVMAPFGAAASLFQGGTVGGVCLVASHDGLFDACGVPAGASMIVVIDRSSRVMAAWPTEAEGFLPVARLALETVRRLGREPATECALPAPVLAMPGLLEGSLCDALIERFESSANFDSGVTGSGIDGLTQHRLDHGRKRRRDWMLQPGDGLYEPVSERLLRRCSPELRRAFQHEVTHTDRILVARYDADGGYFRRHRDNAAPGVAFRQFALSVNLNTGAYTGGHLLFPEYNGHRYRPQTGEGIVFSASLLHEATAVTAGRRYVLLTFLHDRDAEDRRLAQPN